MRKYELYTAQLQALSKQDKIREHERTCADGSTVRDVAKGSQDSSPPPLLLMESFLFSPLRRKNEIDNKKTPSPIHYPF